MTAITTEQLAEWKALAEKATPEPWWPGHLSDDAHPCSCAYVLSETCAGAVCTVGVNNGRAVGDGGNDAPPHKEAKANQRFIAAARSAVPALVAEVERLRAALK